MSVVIVATLLPVPEHRAEVIEVLEKAIATVHEQDSGCELYALHEGADRLVFIEKWASMADIEQHGKNPALADLGPALESRLTEPMDVQVLQPHPAGDAKLGQL